VTWRGKHVRRSPARQPLIVLATAVVLGLGAWSGAGLRTEPTGIAAPPNSAGPVPTGLAAGPGGSDPATGSATTGAATPTTESPPPSSAAASPSPQPAPPADTGVAAFEAEVLAIVNSERTAVGCSGLTVDSRLAAAARAHSTDMATRDYFSHTTPEGVTFDQRITNAGYRWSRVAENIAYGQRNPAAVMEAWMRSTGHRENILNCRLTQIGVGLAYDPDNRPYWTQDFGTPR
jgi:uncharacterized protein YkwD